MRKVVHLELTEPEREELLNAIDVIEHWTDRLSGDKDFKCIKATEEINVALEHLDHFLDSFFPDILGEKGGG